MQRESKARCPEAEMPEAPEELYGRREKRVMDTIALRNADRVPVIAIFGAFAAQYAGLSQQEVMYDIEKLNGAHWKTACDFTPDMAVAPIFFAPAFEAIDYKQLKWAGHGLNANHGFQFAEGEYMKAEEYESFLYDPSDYILRKYWPRVFGTQQFMAQLPPFRSFISYIIGAMTGFMAFAFPGAGDAWEALKRAGDETLKAITTGMDFVRRLETEGGFPLLFRGVTQAPFDTLGDFMRGTRGLMLDMCRRPRSVIAACEKLLPIMLEHAREAVRATGNRRVFIPLHKGCEGLMSDEQFRAFYWPSLGELLVALVDEGITPVVLLEGRYTSRLDVIKDVPEGKLLYWFENVDPVKAKKTLGGKVCIAGAMPVSLLVTSTPARVRAYCRHLMETAAEDGGYILAPSAGDLEDARPDNVKAFFDSVNEYGAY